MWNLDKKPTLGDMIRVNRGLYYHFGIYESDDVIYQFASPKGAEISPDTAVVLTTDLNTFLKDGNLEVREYTEDELKEKRKPEEIINYAKEHLGETGYNLVNNNCEHFANRCVFGKSTSEQVSNVIKFLFGGF